MLALWLGASTAVADSWIPPSTAIVTSADGHSRAIIDPRPLEAANANGEPKTPRVRVEVRGVDGQWRPRWEGPLVNEIAPVRALLANGGQSLVTFDNWGGVGYGDDVVVIYDGGGKPVRKLSLEQLLPRDYLRHLPTSVSSRHWGGEHRFVDGERSVELQVIVPKAEGDAPTEYVPLRVRLADGVVLPADDLAWRRERATVAELDVSRLEAWQRHRAQRLQSVPAPTTRETPAWRGFTLELLRRMAQPGEAMPSIVLPARGQPDSASIAVKVASRILEWDGDPQRYRATLFVSADSALLSRVLAKALARRQTGAMKGFHLVLAALPADAARVESQARRTGARFTWVDLSRPLPPGKPLPAHPPEDFEDWES